MCKWNNEKTSKEEWRMDEGVNNYSRRLCTDKFLYYEDIPSKDPSLDGQ